MVNLSAIYNICRTKRLYYRCFFVYFFLFLYHYYTHQFLPCPIYYPSSITAIHESLATACQSASSFLSTSYREGLLSIARISVIASIWRSKKYNQDLHAMNWETVKASVFRRSWKFVNDYIIELLEITFCMVSPPPTAPPSSKYLSFKAPLKTLVIIMAYPLFEHIKYLGWGVASKGLPRRLNLPDIRLLVFIVDTGCLDDFAIRRIPWLQNQRRYTSLNGD